MTRGFACAIAFLAAGCVASPHDWADVPPPEGTAWTYDVRVADDLLRIDVAMTLRGAPPRSLVLGDVRGAKYVRSPVAAWADGSRALVPEDGEFPLDGVGDDARITWRVDLEAMTSDGGPAMRIGRSVCASPGVW